MGPMHSPTVPMSSPRSNGNVRYKVQQQDTIKFEMQNQLTLFKQQLTQEFENQFKDISIKNSKLQSNLSKLTQEIQQHDSQLQEISQNLGNLTKNFEKSSKIETCLQSPLLSQKIESLTQQTTQSLEYFSNQLKPQIQEEISERFEAFQEKIKEKLENLNHFEQKMSESKHIWSKKVNEMMVGLQNRLQKIENVKNIQQEQWGYQDVLEGIMTQILKIQELVEGKLGQSDLQEVLDGYKHLISESSFQEIESDIQKVKQQLDSNVKNVSILQQQQFKQNEKQTQEFMNRMRSFESFIQNILREFDKKIKLTNEKNQEMSSEKTIELQQKIDQIEGNISQIQSSFLTIEEEISKYDKNFQKIKKESESKYNELIKQIDTNQKQLVYNDRGIKTINEKHKITSEIKQTQLEQQIKQLVLQMNNLQNELQKNYQEFNDKLQKDAYNLNNQMEIFNKENQNILSNVDLRASNSTPRKIIKKSHLIGKNMLANSQEPKNQSQSILDVKGSQFSNKFDDYLKKYEDFNQEVSNYLNARTMPPNLKKSDTDQKYQFQHSNSLSIQSVSSTKSVDSSNESTQQHSNSKMSQNKQHFSVQNNENQKQINNLDTHNINKELQYQEEQNSQFSANKQQAGKYFCILNDKQTGYGYLSAISEKEQEEDEVIYQLDDNGYLLDEQGRQILDDQGRPIQLSQEHIEYLKTENMLEDDYR